MLRETMMSTIPVAMIAMDALCTDRFHKLRGVRNRPPDNTWNPSQMMASASSMPSNRVSSSSARNSPTGLRSSRGAAVRLVGRERVAWVIECRGDWGAEPPHSNKGWAGPILRAGGQRPGGNALAQRSLGNPASIQHDVQVADVDRLWLQQDRATSLPPGVWNMPTLATWSRGVPPHIWIAESPAALPSRRESFQTSTVCKPLAIRFRAGASPSWPETGTLPARPCAASANTTPPAIPSFSDSTASTLLLFCVRNCSISVCAFDGSQLSVYVSPTILMSPLVTAEPMTSL